MNRLRASSRPARFAFCATFLIALTLRLLWVLVIAPAPTFQQLAGGDGQLYVQLGWALAARSLACFNVLGGSAAGPVYPLYLSLFFKVSAIFSHSQCLMDYTLATQQGGADNVIFAARLGQVIMDALMCIAVFDMARRLFDWRVGTIAGLLLALDLRFIVQAAAITTETLFIFFLVSGVWLFVVARTVDSGRGWVYAGSSLFILLAAFTRPLAAPLLPLMAGVSLLPKPTRSQVVTALVVVAMGVLIVASWSWYQYRNTGLPALITDGLAGNFWLGSRGDGQWHGEVEFDRERAEMRARHGGRDAYIEDALQTIAADPLAYGRLLIVKLVKAYLQPQGTVAFPGESLKELAVGVLYGRISLIELVTSDAFWPKLIIYIFHYAGLIGGLIGIGLTRREWLKVLPFILPIVWFTVGYALLTIIPRYIFPIMPFYMILAAYAAATVMHKPRLSSR